MAKGGIISSSISISKGKEREKEEDAFSRYHVQSASVFFGALRG